MKGDFYWRWTGTITQIIGVLGLSSKVLGQEAFIIMMPGALIWLVISLRNKDYSQAALQAVFAIANAIGIWRWM